MAKVTSGQIGEYFKISLYIAGAFFAYKGIMKLAETFGIKKTEEEEKVDKATEEAAGTSTETNVNNPYLSFNPNYSIALIKAFSKKYPKKTFDVKKQMPTDSTQQATIVKTILDAPRFFNDNEDSLYDVFRNIETQYQLARVSKLFSILYKKDLLEYLKGFLSANELKPILDQVKNYPQYLK